MKEEKIIMYDSPEAAEQITLTGWKSKGADGQFWYKDEHMARWAGCTHLKCECGNIMKKNWLKCDECRRKDAVERYNKLPQKEYDPKDVVCTWDGDKYFFSEDEIIEHIEEYNDDFPDDRITEIKLLVCVPIYYRRIDSEDIASDSHEDWEPDDELEQKIKEFNDYLKTLPPHSWTPGKIRTTYDIAETAPK